MELDGKKVAFVVANEGVEEVELTEPWRAVLHAGGSPELIAPERGTVQAFKHLDRGSQFVVDRTLDDADAGEYDAVVLPGGVANADTLRTKQPAVQFVSQIHSAGKPVGVICHGAWTLVEADLVRGRQITSWPSLRTDIENAGGDWVDEEVVVDGQFVSSRKPDDLQAFCSTIVERFAQDGTTRSADSQESETAADYPSV